jgi:hypothetical protein
LQAQGVRYLNTQTDHKAGFAIGSFKTASFQIMRPNSVLTLSPPG